MFRSPKPKRDPEPEKGSIDWLWFRPDGSWSESLYLGNHRMCAHCDVYVSSYSTPGVIKCWVCGKFVPRFKAQKNPTIF